MTGSDRDVEMVEHIGEADSENLQASINRLLIWSLRRILVPNIDSCKIADIFFF